MTRLAFSPYVAMMKEIVFDRSDIRFLENSDIIPILGTDTFAVRIEYGDVVYPEEDVLNSDDLIEALEVAQTG